MEKVQREHGGQGAKSIQDKRVGSVESGIWEGREREAGRMKKISHPINHNLLILICIFKQSLLIDESSIQKSTPNPNKFINAPW